MAGGHGTGKLHPERGEREREMGSGRDKIYPVILYPAIYFL
jgi:hypothetical protein